MERNGNEDRIHIGNENPKWKTKTKQGIENRQINKHLGWWVRFISRENN